MEKILRKVSVSERLPNRLGYYPTNSGLFIFYPNEKNFFHDIENIPVASVEYWYEEISVDELEDFKVAVGNLNMIIEMDALKAKERYKKALDSYYESKINEGVNASDISHNRLVKALKIAAGLNEEEI